MSQVAAQGMVLQAVFIYQIGTNFSGVREDEWTAGQVYYPLKTGRSIAPNRKLSVQTPGGQWLYVCLMRDPNLDASRRVPINPVEDSVADPHVAARKMIVRAVDKGAGRVRKAGNPIRISAYRSPPERLPTPDLDGRREASLGGPGE